MARDERDVAERLDVVDDGRQAVDAALGGERRARGDGAAQALEAGQQRGLLADDVGAGALDDGDVEAKPEPRMSSPRRPSACAWTIASLQRGLGARVLGAHEDEAVARADRVAGERHALEQQVRVVLHQQLVDVGARVALVAVGDDELRLAARRLRANSHFTPAGKPAPPRPRTSAAFTSSSSSSGVVSASALRVARTSRRGGSAPARRAGSRRRGSGAGCVAPASTRSIAPGPASITSPSRTAGRGVAVAEADGLGQRQRAVRRRARRARGRGRRSSSSTWASPVAAKHAVPVHTRTWRAPARHEQVVVEGRDAVDGRLGQPGALRGDAPVVVGDLSPFDPSPL